MTINHVRNRISDMLQLQVAGTLEWSVFSRDITLLAHVDTNYVFAPVNVYFVVRFLVRRKKQCISHIFLTEYSQKRHIFG